MSAYIPDELLEQAKRREDGENTSRLVQRGLERLVAEHLGHPRYAQTPASSFEPIIAVRARHLAEAGEDYHRGYAIALEAASAMSLQVINALVDANFNLEAWLAPCKVGLRNEVVHDAEPIEDLDEMKRLVRQQARSTVRPSSPRNRSDP